MFNLTGSRHGVDMRQPSDYGDHLGEEKMDYLKYPRLEQIEFGAPDANQEYSWSLRSKSDPPYWQSFVDDQIPVDHFMSGRLWMILGHKGSGKTALLRHLARKFRYNVE